MRTVYLTLGLLLLVGGIVSMFLQSESDSEATTETPVVEPKPQQQGQVPQPEKSAPVPEKGAPAAETTAPQPASEPRVSKQYAKVTVESSRGMGSPIPPEKLKQIVEAQQKREALLTGPIKPVVLPPKPGDEKGAWVYDETVQAYLQDGKRVARADADAVNALWACAQRFYKLQNPPLAEDACDLCKLAMDEGSNDPLLIFYYTLMGEELAVLPITESGQKSSLYTMTQHSLGDMFASNYPAANKIAAALYVAAGLIQDSKTPAQTQQAEKLFDQVVELFPEMLKDKRTPRIVLYHTASGISELSKSMGVDRLKTHTRLKEMFENASADSAFTKTLEGDFNIQYAWDARGTGYASTVNDQAWKQFGERLHTARTNLESAWSENQNDSYTARRMMGVCLGESAELNELDLWFNRAIKLDPNRAQIYGDKLIYLLPRWHGDLQQLHNFGQECLKRFKDGQVSEPAIALQPIQVLKWTYWELNREGSVDFKPFMNRPKNWAIIKNTYDAILERYPKSRLYRAQYALTAALIEKWDEANQLFADVPDDNVSIFTVRPDGERLRQKAAQLAKKP